jgi:HAD superfamily hydrolase (TIGR01549 family)
MRYTTVFFDMGHTLALRRPRRTEVLGQFLRERSLDRTPEALRRAYLAADEYHCQQLAVVPVAERTDDFWSALYREGHVQALRYLDLPVEALLDEFLTVLRLTPRANAVYEDVHPTLEHLRACGMKLAVVSNWNHTLEERCAELGLCDYFQAIVGSYAVGLEKPAPGIFQIALARVGSAAAETVHVGDLLSTDVQGAWAAGITPVLIDRDDLHPDGEYVRITRLEEIIHWLG